MNSARLHHFAQEFGVPDDFFLCRQVLEYEEAKQLVTAATNADGREHRLSPEAAKAWKEMHAAALNSGISLFIVSAFRSVQRQAELIRRKLAAGQSITEVLSVSALPGCSEHHTGNAVAVGTARSGFGGIPGGEEKCPRTTAITLQSGISTGGSSN